MRLQTRRRRGALAVRPRLGLHLEPLEARCMLAVFTVSNENDSGSGSLRWAIEQANTSAGADVIEFAITGSGVRTISLDSPLPAITEELLIDGLSQGGSSNTDILVQFDGTTAGSGADGLAIEASDVEVRGLAIGRFEGYAIRITADETLIAGNHLGTDAAGTSDTWGNGAGGIYIVSANNVIGGTADADRNIISGNDGPGVTITGENATGNQLLGNYIGLDAAGAALGNDGAGVLIEHAAENTIGGAAEGALNVISSNSGAGVHIVGEGEDALNFLLDDLGDEAEEPTAVAGNDAYDNAVVGNYIGTTTAGDAARANGAEGVLLEHASRNAIGGSAAGEGNVIAGNTGAGVRIIGSAQTSIIVNLDESYSNSYHDDAQANRVLGNLIGVTADAEGPLPNAVGVLMESVSFTEVGGSESGEGNVISGNSGHGLAIQAADSRLGSRRNQISGNIIGTNEADADDLGNGGSGIYIAEGARFNFIGGDTEASRNVISGNVEHGVWVRGTAELVSGETSDVDPTPTTLNIQVASSTSYDLGGVDKVKLTLHSGHGLIETDEGYEIEIVVAGHSVTAYNSSSSGLITMRVLEVDGNDVYTDLTYAGSGGTGGIWSIAREHVMVPFNTWTDLGDTLWLKTTIHTYARTSTGVELTTIYSTVEVGEDPEAAMADHPAKRAQRTYLNFVSGNFIGTDSTGTSGLGNGRSGVYVSDGALLTQIGAWVDADADDEGSVIFGMGNVIADNADHGIEVQGVRSYTYGAAYILHEIGEDDEFIVVDQDTLLTFIRGNLVGTDATGQEELGNGLNGLYVFDAARGMIVGVPAANEATDLTEDELAPLRNVFSANGQHGVHLQGDFLTLVEVGGSYIGTNLGGTAGLGNSKSGVVMEDGANASFIGTDNAIGPPLVVTQQGVGNNLGPSQASNLIAGNAEHGIVIRNTTRPLQFRDQGRSGSDRAAVYGNLIGVNKDGQPIPNGTVSDPDTGDGILIENASLVEVGVGILQTVNVISGNLRHGIHVTGSESFDNIIAQNVIGGDPRSLPIELGGTGQDIYAPIGNGGHGILFADGAHDNTTQHIINRHQVRATAAQAYMAGLTSFANYELIAAQFDTVHLFGDAPVVVLDGNEDDVFYDFDFELQRDSETGAITFNALPSTEMIVRVLRNYIQGNALDGIAIEGDEATGNLVAGNLVGTNGSGDESFVEMNQRLYGNAGWGIALRNGAHGNSVGSSAPLSFYILEFALFESGLGVIGIDIITLTGDQSQDLQRNVVAGNGEGGILLHATSEPENVRFNHVVGNFIGFGVDGTPLGNFGHGVLVDNAPRTAIGGFEGAGGNIIAANAGDGIRARGDGLDHLYIGGNIVGSDGSFTGLPGNEGAGIRIEDNSTAEALIVGTWQASLTDLNGIFWGNLISGNGEAGVHFVDVVADLGDTPPRIAGVFGSQIGLSLDGTAFGNGGDGILIEDSVGVIVGLVSGNTISGNTASGIHVTGSETSNTLIAGNLIGLDPTGAAARGNGGDGVLVDGGAEITFVGFYDDEEEEVVGNTISGNEGHGIRVSGSGTAYTLIGANRIGTNEAGTTAVGNGGAGVLVENGTGVVRIGANLQDGFAEQGNLIAGNAGHGIDIRNVGIGAGSTLVGVAANLIGLNASGTEIANGGSGVYIEDAANVTVGGLDAVSRNVISGNTLDGVHITGGDATSNRVTNNRIGTNAAGTAALGNGGAGVRIDDGAHDNRIGNAFGDFVGNLISGNDSHGVVIAGTGSDGNLVQSNLIGTNAAGTSDLGNAGAGIYIDGGNDNLIGGGSVALGNFIAYNGSGSGSGPGVAVAAGVGNTISRNAFFAKDRPRNNFPF